MPISDEVRQAIRERANYICEYCHSPERLSANRFTVDHVVPKSLGGSDALDNLALACRLVATRDATILWLVLIQRLRKLFPFLIPANKNGQRILFGKIRALL
uniref:HNH endonuclease n=1 Tax=Petrachloros mirabilis TaxID=2918835 RepID=UPI0030845201